MSNANELQRLKQNFLKHIEIDLGRSDKTIENYNRYISRFLKYSKINKAKDIKMSVVDKYTMWLCRQKTRQGQLLTKKTQNYHLIALRMFLSYLFNLNIISLEPKKINLTKVKDLPQIVVTRDEAERILNASVGSSIKFMRDRAILCVLFFTDLSVSELVSLNTDIDLAHCKITVYVNDKLRTVSIPQDAVDAVQAYLAVRKDVDKVLFVNNSKRVSDNGSTRLSVRSIQRIVRFYSIKAGVNKKVTPQILRNKSVINKD